MDEVCARLANLGTLLGIDGLPLTLPPEDSAAEARPMGRHRVLHKLAPATALGFANHPGPAGARPGR